jgi:hypothetical protein
LREDLEFINTLAAIYGLARLSYSLRNVKGKQLLKDIKTAVITVDKQASAIFQDLKNLFNAKSKSEALFREIFKLINKGILSEYQFMKLARKMEGETGIKLHLIDATNLKFKDLYKAWKENPVYAMFHNSTFKNTKYGIVLEGPAIYFFRGGDIALTSYTMQHELFHVKLWHKLVKEFGNKGGTLLYNKIPQWLHEADVVGEFIKANKLRPSKWSMIDIEEDLKILNKRRKEIGLPGVSLDFFKDWDITKHINL